MAGVVSMRLLGDWNKEVGVGLKDMLHVSMDVMGRTGEQAARHALILMAQSAGAMMRTNRRTTRPVLKDEHGKYVEAYVQGRSEPYKLYEWMFSDDNEQERIPGTWQNAKRIGNIGLGKRSWMWGMRRLGVRGKISKSIPGGSRVYTITKQTLNGYIKQNRLDYVLKVLPPGWERTVERLAGDKIMGQARKKLEREWKSAMRRRERRGHVAVKSLFKQMV